MPKAKYPQLVIDLGKLKDNIDYAVTKAGEKRVSICGVVKGFNAIPEMAEVYLRSGVSGIGSSRMDQLKAVKKQRLKLGVYKPLVLLRIPMLSEANEVVEYCEASLNSEIKVLTALDKAAARKDKLHRVILMVDVGDLREGFWNREELVEAAFKVERDMENLYLAGVGTNVGCYGSLVPTKEKLQELVDGARAVEKAIGRPLDVISGGASTSFMRITDGDMPEGINHLRMGENILNARDNIVHHGHDTAPQHRDIFTLRAQVVEVKDKPSYPVGEINVDAFGNKPEYEDRGVRKKALLAVGKLDYGAPSEIFPKMPGVEVLGASSDHTILDIQDAENVQVGDVLDFDIDYASMVYLTSSAGVQKVFKN